MDTDPSPLVATEPRIRAAYAEGAGIYRIVPSGVARPTTEAELVAVVRQAGASGTPLVARGAGTGMSGANVGEGIVVDLTRLDGAAIEVDPLGRTAWTAPGATFAALNRAAAPHGLRLPPAPSSWRWATLGGVAAANASGARSFRYGSARRWVEALALVTADGDRLVLERGRPADPSVAAVERFRASVAPALHAAGDLIRARFPATRKNSFGYALDVWSTSGDLIDLIVGAEGTLGIITGIRWRLDAMPAVCGGMRVTVATDASLAKALEVLRESGASAVELLDRTFLEFVLEHLPADDRTVASGAAAMLLVEFEGDGPTVAAELDRWRRRLAPMASDLQVAEGEHGLEQLWAIRHAASPILTRLSDGRRSLQVIEDGCVPPARLPEYLTALRRIAARQGIGMTLFGHAGDGHVHVNLLPDVTRPGWERLVATVFEAASEAQIALGGTPSGEHGAGRLRAGLMELVYGPEIVELFRAVKRAFDPAGIMNPGVILPGDEAGSPVHQLKIGDSAVPIPEDIAAALRQIEQAGAWDVDRSRLADAPAAASLATAGA
jgi:FAD/FMN-containing dehydrogenase